ncbi:MAG: hypothetical protein J6O17_05165 [Eubacterium sp.]|nr:hypothetical protein [Eubacterium sp.]
MYRMLCSDLRRLFSSKLFYLGLIFYAFLYTGINPFIMWIIHLFTHDSPGAADIELAGQAGTAAIAIAIFVTSFVMKEFTDGAIRNKLSSGAKRSDIYLSSVITMIVATIAFQAVSLVSILIFGNVFMAGFESPMTYILQINVIYLIAAVSITIFDVTLMFIFAGNNISLFAAPFIAVAIKFLAMMVLEDLYPETGELLISGTRLAVFTFIDKYIPFMHLINFPRFGWDAYIIGGAVLSAVSLILGMVIFEKKDLK